MRWVFCFVALEQRGSSFRAIRSTVDAGESALITARLPFDNMESQTIAPTVGPNLNGHSDTANGRSQSNNPWQIVLLPVATIGPNPFQPRSVFDEAEMLDLVASVRAHGVLQPVTVRTAPADAETNGKTAKKASLSYQLIAGERRLRACREAGRKSIPAIVRDDLSDVQAAELALVENVQRSNLNVIEEAGAYKRLMLDFRMKEERIAKKVGKSVAIIKEMLRLLALPESVQNLLAKRQLSAAHGHELLRLAPHPKICESVALRCVSDKITATSLAANLLPNANELKRSGLITEVGFATKFDWRSVCKECPHKALVSSGYSSFCLRPDEWRKKQDGAIEMQKQEATRVMEEAREVSNGIVEVERLAPGSYRRLLHVQVPAGCSESCACRSETCDPTNPTKRMPVCLNPGHFEELRETERKANEEFRKRRYSQDWKNAIEKLQSGESGPVLTAALLIWPILRLEYRSYIQPDAWQSFVQGIAANLEIELPWSQILDRETPLQSGLKQLQAVEPQMLLRLGAGLILAQEAETAIRYAGETPQLDIVLGREVACQTELEPSDDEDEEPDDNSFMEDYEPGDIDYPDELEE